MNGSRGLLFLVLFLFAMLMANNLFASCWQQKHPVASAAGVSDVDDSGSAPVCTSTVSCPLPPPRHHEQAAP